MLESCCKKMLMKETGIKDFYNLTLGNAGNQIEGTGFTVLIFQAGTPAGLRVRDGLWISCFTRHR